MVRHLWDDRHVPSMALCRDALRLGMSRSAVILAFRCAEGNRANPAARHEERLKKQPTKGACASTEFVPGGPCFCAREV